MATPYGQGRVYDPNVNASTSQNSTTVAGNLNNTTGTPQNTVSQGGTTTGNTPTPTGRTIDNTAMNQSVGGNQDLQNVNIPDTPPANVQPQRDITTQVPNTEPVTNTPTPTNTPAQTTTTQPVTPQEVPNTPQQPQTQTNESSIRISLPSKNQIKNMTREELINLKTYLTKYCYKEAMENYDKFNVKRFAKECFKSHKNIPAMLNQYYPDVITPNIKTTYNKLLELASVTDNPEVNIKNQVKTSLDYTINLFSNSTDWISIVMSRKLKDYSAEFSNTNLGRLSVGRFFIVSALCASVVYFTEKFFKAKHFLGANDSYTLSDSEQKKFDEIKAISESDVQTKLSGYETEEIPTSVLMINSLILKATKKAMGLLMTIAYQNPKDFEAVPVNILVLTEVCCAMVLLWGDTFGIKMKKAKIASNLYECISPWLTVLMDVDPQKPARDIFNKLNNYAKQK